MGVKKHLYLINETYANNQLTDGWFFPFSKVAVRVRPLNGSEVEDKSCTEIAHVLDENVGRL